MGNTRTPAEVAWTEPRLGRLCEVAAAAISPGRRSSGISGSSRSCLDTDEAADTAEHVANDFKVVEVDAFASVHDMIHAAISAYGKQATLREIYRACQQRGRIAYKRSGGSRLITHNDHWKSQIRHALYTCDRFARAADAHDLWTVSAAFSKQQPQTTKVLIRTDPDAASVNDDSADAQRRQGLSQQAASRHTRSKHSLDEPILQHTPKQKRSRTIRVAAKNTSPGSSAVARSRHKLSDTPSGSVAFSSGPSNRMLSGSDYSDMGERAASASAFQPYSCDASTAAATPVLQHEGEDESSHNEPCMQVLPQMYVHDGMATSYEPGLLVQPNGVVHRGLPVLGVHPYFTECHDAHQIVASSMVEAASTQNRTALSHSNQPADTPFRFAPHHPNPTPTPNHHQQTHTSPPLQPGLRRTLSAEADSPAESQVYSLRSRLAPRVTADFPNSQQNPNPLSSNRVHNFFTCHSKVIAPVPPTPLGLSPQTSTLHSNMPESPPNRRTAVRQGLAGRPPVLPKNGRTQSLLAAAHKAQTATFGTATPLSLGQQAHDKPYQGSPRVMDQSCSMVHSRSVDQTTPHCSGGDATALDPFADAFNGRLLRSRRLNSNDATQ